MVYEWINIIAAVITSSTTFVAVIVAWRLTKNSLYNYQERQDLKKEEIRLIQRVMNANKDTFESFLWLTMSDPEKESLKDARDNIIKSALVLSAYNLILEEIKTIFSISSPTYKKYKSRILTVDSTLKEFPFSQGKEAYTIAHKFQSDMNNLNKDLINLIHKKTNEKISVIGKKKKNRKKKR